MKQILLMIVAVVAVGGCGKKATPAEPETNAEPKVAAEKPEAAKVEPKKPEPPKVVSEKLVANPNVERAIRSLFSLNKPTGELTKADLEKVSELRLSNTKITDAGLKDIAKLQNLRLLDLDDTQITAAGLKEEYQLALHKKPA